MVTPAHNLDDAQVFRVMEMYMFKHQPFYLHECGGGGILWCTPLFMLT